jgi:hypothetical protein
MTSFIYSRIEPVHALLVLLRWAASVLFTVASLFMLQEKQRKDSLPDTFF